MAVPTANPPKTPAAMGQPPPHACACGAPKVVAAKTMAVTQDVFTVLAFSIQPLAFGFNGPWRGTKVLQGKGRRVKAPDLAPPPFSGGATGGAVGEMIFI